MGGGRVSYFPYILLNEIQTMFSQLAKRSAKVFPADLCNDHAHYVSTVHSRPQSPSFLGHVVGKRGALEAAVTGCQKISDIRSRMCRSYKYHCSCSYRIFVPHRSTGGKILLPELSAESGFVGMFWKCTTLLNLDSLIIWS